MKNIYLITFLILFMLSDLYSQTASEIIEKADNKLRGSSSYSELVITIVRPKWEKKMILKNWSIGSDFSSTLVTSPAKEKGTVFLKRNNEIWNYLPSLERTVKFPPSMMTQSWMGTDFTTDDLVKQSSTVTDYSHKILAEENIQNLPCWKLELIPKEEATVVWGKLVIWVDKKDYMQLRTEFYDEDEELVNLMIGSDIKTFGNKKLPSKLEFIPLENEGQKTVIDYNVWKFNIVIPENYFKTQYISRLK